MTPLVGWLLICVGGVLVVADLGHQQLQRKRSTRPGPSWLETWIESRLEESGDLARQRSVRGDVWFFNAMGQWDDQNCNEMAFGNDAVAPDLVDAYRRHGQPHGIPGIPPPYGPAEYDWYYEQRLAWLRETLAKLKSARRRASCKGGRRRGA